MAAIVQQFEIRSAFSFYDPFELSESWADLVHIIKQIFVFIHFVLIIRIRRSKNITIISQTYFFLLLLLLWLSLLSGGNVFYLFLKLLK